MPLRGFSDSRLKVAIIGAGPAGLGAAIEFGKLPFVNWTIYEQATLIREIGAGISLPRNTWRMLDFMGALENIKPDDMHRPADHHSVQHRNGRTGELLVSHIQSDDIPAKHLHARTRRSTLQNALLREVDKKNIRLKSRLVRVEQQPSGKLALEFQDGFTDVVDLLVGADGVRSVVRTFAFPDHRVGYIGRTAYRTIVSAYEVNALKESPEIINAVTFWHAPTYWLYTCPLGSGHYEITTNIPESGEQSEKTSWGQEATLEQLQKPFTDFVPLTRKILALAKDVKQYALFAGPRLEEVTAHGSVALVGDASHPLSGAFGTGAGFALEDVYVLTQSVAWAYVKDKSLPDALALFDKIRGPYYKRLYGVLDEFAEAKAHLDEADLGFDDAVLYLTEKNWNKEHGWIQEYDVQQVFRKVVQNEEDNHSVTEEKARL